MGCEEFCEKSDRVWYRGERLRGAIKGDIVPSKAATALFKKKQQELRQSSAAEQAGKGAPQTAAPTAPQKVAPSTPPKTAAMRLRSLRTPQLAGPAGAAAAATKKTSEKGKEGARKEATGGLEVSLEHSLPMTYNQATRDMRMRACKDTCIQQIADVDSARHNRYSPLGGVYRDTFQSLLSYNCKMCTDVVARALSTVSNLGEQSYCANLKKRVESIMCTAMEKQLKSALIRMAHLDGREEIRQHSLSYLLSRLFVFSPDFRRFLYQQPPWEKPPLESIPPPSAKAASKLPGLPTLKSKLPASVVQEARGPGQISSAVETGLKVSDAARSPPC